MEQGEIEHFRFHDLRHTFATRLVQAGVGIHEVQKPGRWKNASMVMRYAHHNPESSQRFSFLSLLVSSMIRFV